MNRQGKFLLFVCLGALISICRCVGSDEKVKVNLETLLSRQKEILNFIQHPYSRNWDANAGSSWLSRLVVPHYLAEFVNLFDITQENLNQNLTARFLDGVNDECGGHVLEFMMRIRLQTNGTNLFSEKDKWVVQMSDSWGNTPEGILTGHLGAFGDFDECIGIKATNLTVYNKMFPGISKSFEGRYCTSIILDHGSAMAALEGDTGIYIAEEGEEEVEHNVRVNRAVSVEEFLRLLSLPSPLMIIPSVATCWPNTCSQVEVQRLLVNGANISYSLLTGFGFPEEYLPWPVTISCQQAKKPDLDAASIVMIVIILVIIALCLVAGIVDYWQNHDVDDRPPRSLPYQYFMAFSMYTNTKKWLSTRTSPDNMGCVHGIRFLSTSWVVLAHTYAIFKDAVIWNWVDVKLMYEDWTILAVINGTVSVDTFFVLSGMLAAVGIMKTLDKSKGKLNILMMYVHRYIRLTPTYAIIVGVGATLLNYAGNNPKWKAIELEETLCRENWWTNLLYINNIFHMQEMCNAESWYLANDMQFYMLSPFMVYPLWRWEKFGLLCLVVWTLLSWLAPFLVVLITNTQAVMVITGDMMTGGEHFLEIYMRPWSRIQTYIVGIWLGWILYKTRNKYLKLPKWVVAMLWTISTVTALAGVFGPYKYFNPEHTMPKRDRLVYAALGRTSFGIAVAIVVFLCIKGYGGIVNKFLSWKVFMPLGRLCFCVYLISMYLQMILHFRFPNPIKYDPYIMVNFFFAHMVMSFLAGFFCSLMFESPFIILQKLIFEGGEKPKPQVQKSE